MSLDQTGRRRDREMPKQEKPLTQAEVIAAIMEVVENQGWDNNLSKRMVKDVLNSLLAVMVSQLRMKGIAKVTVPFLGLKLEVVTKAATKERKGISPFSGEEMTFKAKPKRKVVKARAMKSLKDAVVE
jgi:nucleoid DNA-binding protein